MLSGVNYFYHNFDENAAYPFDPTSSTWKHVKSVLNKELRSLREMNDNESLDAIKTAALRGRIAAIGDILLIERH